MTYFYLDTGPYKLKPKSLKFEVPKDAPRIDPGSTLFTVSRALRFPDPSKARTHHPLQSG